MKVKNIIFSGAMASILMVGGAYAANNANNDLATAGFVRGAYNAAVETALTNVSADDDTVTLTKDVTEKGDAATIKIKVNASKFDAAGAATSAAAGALSDAKTYADTKAGAAETAAKTYADTKAGAAETAAKTYADTKAGAAETAAKTYADGLNTAMDSRVDALESTSAKASDLSTLQETVAGHTTLISGNAAAISAEEARATEAEEALAGRLGTAEGEIDTLQSDMTTAENTIIEHGTSIQANASAISAEETRAKAAEQANASAISAEETRAKGVEATNAAAALAAQTAANAAQADVDALELVVGTVEEGKTVVDMIADAQEATTYTGGDGVTISGDNVISAVVDNSSIKIDANKKITLGYDVTNGTFSK